MSALLFFPPLFFASPLLERTNEVLFVFRISIILDCMSPSSHLIFVKINLMYGMVLFCFLYSMYAR